MTKQVNNSIKTVSTGYTNIRGFTKGLIIAYIVTAIMFSLFAIILSYLNFPEKFIPTVVKITGIISVLVASSASVKNLKNRGWLNGSILGFIYSLTLYFISSIISNDFSINNHIAMTTLVSIFAGAIGGIIGINLK